MHVVRTPLICFIAALFLLSAVGTVTAEVPDHDDDIYTWKYERDDEHPSQSEASGCYFNSPSPEVDPNAEHDSACKIESYEIGNTDTHMFFRWTLATLEFGANEDLRSPVSFDQGFRGTGAEGERKFKFRLWVDADEAWVDDDEGNTEPGWAESIDVEIMGDRSDGVLVAAVPHELVATKLASTFAGDHFNLSAPPKTEAKCGDAPFACFAALGDLTAGNHELAGAASEANRTFTLEPYGDLQRPPKAIYENITGFGDSPLEIVLDPSTRVPWSSDIYIFNWTLDHPAFDIELEPSIDAGAAEVSITDPFGENMFQAQASGGAEESFVGVSNGVWNITIDLNRFAGSLKLHLHEGELPEGGGGGDGDDDDTDNEDEDGGGDGGNVDEDEKESPAPGIVLVLVALISGIAGARRLRRRA